MTSLRPFPCRLSLAVLLISLLALVACTKSEEGQQSGEAPAGDYPPNTLVFLVPSEPPSFDAHREITFATIHPTAPHYSLLVKVDPEDPGATRIVGDVAESWTVSADKKTYTFTLHGGVTFHDGSALTSRDVVASLNHVMFPGEGVISPRKAYYTMVESVTAPDPRTVVIRLKFATAAFLPALAQPFNYIYSADKLAQDVRWYEKNIMGSGPFVFKEYTPGATWRGERFANYFKAGLPKLDAFEAIFAPKESVRLQALRGSRAMIEFRGFSPQGRDDLVRALGGRIRVQESVWNCNTFIVPNSHKKPFDDVRVRKALSLALDRYEGSKYLSRIATVNATGGVVFPGHRLAFTEDELAALPGYGRDIQAARAEARRLLKEAGVPEGFKFRLHNRAVDQPYKIVGTWIIDQWRQIGLDVEQWVQQDGPFFQTLYADPPEFETSIDFNCAAVVNPTLDISKFISTDKSDANYGRYIDRELDRLFDAQLRETDEAKQEALVHQFEKRLLADEVHYISIFWWHRIIPHDARVKGWTASPSHYLNQDLSTVYLEE